MTDPTPAIETNPVVLQEALAVLVQCVAVCEHCRTLAFIDTPLFVGCAFASRSAGWQRPHKWVRLVDMVRAEAAKAKEATR